MAEFDLNPTSVWLWASPKDGELVPDFPPTDLTPYIVSMRVDDGPAGSDQESSDG